MFCFFATFCSIYLLHLPVVRSSYAKASCSVVLDGRLSPSRIYPGAILLNTSCDSEVGSG
jgi:hypothetical protein